MAQVSILIPTYNPTDYLARTLEAMCAQTGGVETEILVGDDGSEDTGYLSSVRAEFEGRGVRFIKLPHGGLSMARRRLLEYATGDYILFCDDDDYYAPGAVENMLRLAREHNVKMVTVLYTHNEKRLSAEGDVHVWDGETCACYCLHQTHGVRNCAPGKLYEAGWLRQWVHRMPEGMLYEDLAMLPPMLAATDRVAVSMAKLYFYRMRQGSILHTLTPTRADVLDVVTGLMDEFTDHPRLYAAACDRAFSAACNIYALFSKHGSGLEAGVRRAVMERAVQIMSTTRRYSLTGAGVRIKNRIGALLATISPRLIALL
ncbi:MAG: glycosyltransferase [Muribaculaceae bacterium]|nr:glycosyltransferase [Muribaculaceae bacterium]